MGLSSARNIEIEDMETINTLKKIFLRIGFLLGELRLT